MNILLLIQLKKGMSSIRTVGYEHRLRVHFNSVYSNSAIHCVKKPVVCRDTENKVQIKPVVLIKNWCLTGTLCRERWGHTEHEQRDDSNKQHTDSDIFWPFRVSLLSLLQYSIWTWDAKALSMKKLHYRGHK